MIFLRCQSFQR